MTEASFILSSHLTANPPEPPAPAESHGPLPLVPSSLSPDRVGPLEDLLLSTPWGDPLIPESILPLDPKFLPDAPPDPLASFPLLTEEMQASEVVLQLETTRALLSRPSEVPTNIATAKGTDYVTQALPGSSLQQPAADRQLSSDLAHSLNQHLPHWNVSQACLQGDTGAYLLQPEYVLPPNFDVLKLFKRQDNNGSDFLKSKEKTKGSFTVIQFFREAAMG